MKKNDWLAFAAIGAVFAALTTATWRKWPDALIDFGLQLYLPWALSRGAVLDRDVFYVSGGPLSQYYHALLFKIFGASVLTIVISNLAVLGIFLAIAYYCFLRASDRLTALVACLAVLLVFAFAHYTEFGIFNYITPYSHEAFHGIVLSTIAIALLLMWLSRDERQSWLPLAAGFFSGLSFLAKPEVFLGLAISVAGCLALLLWKGNRRRLFPRAIVLLLTGAAVPLAASFLLFSQAEDAESAARSVVAAWAPLLAGHAGDNRFYRWCLGLDAPALHIQSMALHFLVLTATYVFCAWLFRRKITSGFDRVRIAIVILAVTVLAWEFDWHECGTSLPLICLTCLAILLWRVKSRGLEPAEIFPMLWTLFSLGLLLKLGLHPRIWHYGFALAMPAFLTAIYLLLWLAPKTLEPYSVRGDFLRLTVCLVLLAGFVRLTQYSRFAYEMKTLPVAQGADRFYAFDPRFRPSGAVTAAALRWVETNTPPNTTLAVLPEGAMLNFLSRRRNPTGYPGWSPPEIAAFGQTNMYDAFVRHPPDCVILVGIDSSEFGEKYFGTEKRFGLDLMQWIERHYEPLGLIGHDWSRDGGFGMKIFRKRSQ